MPGIPLLEDRTYVQFGFKVEYIEESDGLLFIAHLPTGTRMRFPLDQSARKDMLAAALPRDPDERKKLAAELLAPSLLLPNGKVRNDKTQQKGS